MTEKFDYRKSELFLLDWTTKRIDKERSFNDFFYLDGTSLGWIFEKMFYSESILPIINSYGLVESGKKITFLKQYYYNFLSSIFSKVLLLKEVFKFRFSKSKVSFDHQEKKKTTLFLTYKPHLQNDGTIKRIQDIIDILKKEKKLRDLALFADPLSSYKKSNYGSLTNIYSYYQKGDFSKAYTLARKLHKKIKSLPLDIKKRIFTAQNKSFFDYTKHLFNFYFSTSLLTVCIFYYNLFLRIIETENVKTIVLTSSNNIIERCLIAAAKKKNVTPIVIQHGMGLGRRPLRDDLGTKFAVFSELHKKRLIHWGVSKKNIFVVGPLVYNSIYPYLKKRKSHKKGKHIFLTTQALIEVNLISKEKYFLYLENILDKLSKIHGVKITIKLHPREIYREDYINLIKKYTNVFLSKKNASIYQLICDSDVLLNFYGSSTILEASILDVPSVTINLPNLSQSYFGDYDPSIQIDYTKDLVLKIEETLKHPLKTAPKRKKLVKDWCSEIDGKSPKRVVDIINMFSK